MGKVTAGSFIANTRRLIKARLKKKDEFLRGIDDKIAKKKSVQVHLDKIESIINAEHETIKAISSSKLDRKTAKIVDTTKRVINEAIRAINLLKSQATSEIQTLEGNKVSIDEFVRKSLEEIKEIKIQAAREEAKAEKEARDSGKPIAPVVIEQPKVVTLSASLFKLASVKKDVSAVYRKKKKVSK
jgi:hypothetical protein